MVEGMISFVDLEGNKLWHKNLKEGELTKIIRTSDGNYLAVGTTMSTQDIAYNPTSTNPNNLFRKNIECGSFKNKRKAYLVKVDPNGEILWEYIYGLKEFATNAQDAYKQNTLGFDVAEQDGFYYLTGFAINLDHQTPRENNYIIKVNENGMVQNKKFIGDLSKYGKGGTIAIFKDNTNAIKIAVGCEVINIGVTEFTARVVMLDDNLSELNVNGGNYWSVNPDPTKSTRVWGIAFNSNGDLWFPVATNCDECSASFHGTAEDLNVYKLNTTTGNFTLTTSLGKVVAYDLRMGITNTSDGGFAIISTKLSLTQTYKPSQSNVETCPYPTGTTRYWRSCAYVAKCDASGVLEWQKQWDAKTPRQSGAIDTWMYPNLNYDVKTAECMYSIVQNDDGSYTVAGNNSTNFDDEYLVKLNGDCDQRLANNTFDIINTTGNTYTLTANESWNTSKKVKASVVVPNGITLTISGVGTTIEFADSRKCGIRTNIILQPGGRLIINDAKLTSLAACAGTNSKWDGILVEGNSSLDQINTANQGYVLLNDAIVEKAVTAISTSAYIFSSNLVANIDWTKTGGGIIKANNTKFEKNNRHIEFMAYKNNVYVNATTTAEYSNVSSFYNCSFEMEGTNFSNDLNSSKRTMVTAWGVKGVRFTACDFKNNTGAINADKEFYDRRFCEFQIKEWNKNLKYYTRKMEKTKTEPRRQKERKC
jgi:hypothetical protein